MQNIGMPSDRIKCPNCGEVMPITETLHRQLADEVRAAIQEEVVQRQQELAAKEKELRVKESHLQRAEGELEVRVATRVKAEKQKLTDSALQVARTEVAVQLQDLQKEAASKEEELKKSRESELQLLQAKRELQTAKDALELQVARQLEQERGQIREAALKEADEVHRLREAEKDLRLAQALKMNEDLRRKLEQGSQQIQGEVLELDLERTLRSENPLDEISEVPKGVRGADLLHKVTSRAGLVAGLILWEAKNTKNWGEGWIGKLKEDQRAAKADVAVIVSDVLPKSMDGFGFRMGVDYHLGMRPL